MSIIRCSALGNIMTEPKTKAEKEMGVLSKTTQSYLDELIFSYKYKREKSISNKYTEKGIETEDDGIHLLNLLHKSFYQKNEVRFENGTITGEPDIITADTIIDIKSTYDFTTFIKKTEIEKSYYWQLCGYCLLTGMRKGAIAYVLNNTPFHIVENEFISLYYKRGAVELSDYEKAKIALGHIYHDRHIINGEMRDGYWDYLALHHFPNYQEEQRQLLERGDITEKDLIEFVEVPMDKRLRYYTVEFSDNEFDKLQSQINKATDYIQNNYERF